MTSLAQQQQAPTELLNVVKYLRSSKSGIKVRVGAINGKRIDYFKGKGAIKALQSPAYAALKNVPPVPDEAAANDILVQLINHAFFLRVQRSPAPSSKAPKVLTVVQQQMLAPGEYYAWFYEGPQWTMYAGAALMLLVMLAGVMFPLWPPTMRLGVWYLSIGMLGLIGLFFGIAIVRLIFYIITLVVASPGIWIFPKLFADVGFVDSFIPLWEWDLPKKKSKRSKKSREDKQSEKDAALNGGGAYIEEVEDSGDGSSRPVSRGARVEEVADDE